MPHIQQLPPHLADLIAAGEVVERPASVVKELVENAIDAGASAVTVEIQQGGMAYIRVTDDGGGMDGAELPVAFLRHATSKLRTAEDLGAIGTLGFRGEALAAIAAVSRVEVMTRRPGATAGASLELEGGVPGQVEAAGCPPGTTVVVRDLFYNTPARLKFMRKDSAEGAAVAGLLQHLALSHPHIAFRFLRDGQEQMNTPGSGDLHAAVYAALGREFAMALVPVAGESEGAAVSGFVTKPVAGRGTRGMQFFFVNGRCVKSQLLAAALEEAYRNQLLKGRFPGCVLHITLPPERVDVNVHPAKTVVKFVSERPLFSLVHHTVADALTAAGGAVPAPREDFYQTMTAAQFREEQTEKGREAVIRVRPDRTELPDRRGAFRDSVRLPESRPPHRQPAPAAGDWAPLVTPRPAPAPAETGPAAPPPAEREAPPPQPEQLGLAAEETAPWRYVGEVLRTYIVAEDGENVWLIDKHAAHERINFDRLKANPEPPMRQRLLVPAAVDLSPEDAAALLAELELLDRFGFAAEDFGGGTILVREIPSDIDEGQIRETLEMLAGKLRSGGSADPESARDAMLHTMACKAAIKGGWHSDPRELQALVDRVRSGEVRYCPHGRPVAVKLTRYELEKMFKRA